MTTVARKYGNESSSFKRSTFKHPAANKAPEAKAPVVLMISGGADSSALLLMAATGKLDIDDGRGPAKIAKERLHVLHINHGLRGLAAKEDEELVQNMAAHLGIPCTVVSVDVPALVAKTPGESFESVARNVRYEEASKLANQLSKEFGTPRGAARILTAHTADDRAETFFINAIKGAGPAGLSSIPFRRNRIVRPLLYKTHQELCDYLRLHNIVWAEDATNEDISYLRNYVRKEILPLAKAKNPQLVSALSSTCDVLSDEDSYLAGVSAKAYARVLESKTKGVRVLNAKKLAAADVAIARRVLREALLGLEPEARLEASHVTQILEALAEGSGSFNVVFGIHVRVENGTLTLKARRAQGPKPPFHGSWLSIPGSVQAGENAIMAEIIELTVANNPVALAKEIGQKSAGKAVFLDAEKAQATAAGAKLWVAPPEAGQVLCPLGMHGQSKKLSDLLIDAHVQKEGRLQVPVVSLGLSKEIVWVAGIRVDERFAVTPTSQTLLLLRMQKGSKPSC